MNGMYDADREWNDAEEFEKTQLHDDVTKEDVAGEVVVVVDRSWIHDASEVLRLARWLVEIGYIEELGDLLYFFEKPWKWTPERTQMLAIEAGDAFVCDVCDDIVPVEYEEQSICESCTDRKHEDEMLSRGADK